MDKFHEPPEIDDMVQIRAGLPVKPYKGTGGWSGTETSKDRAEYDVRSGNLSRTQLLVVQALGDAMSHGCIVHEIKIPRKDGNGYMHHGSVSGALSNLHMVGKISRLAEKRGNCHIYVLNKYVNDRQLSAFTPHPPKETKFRLVDDKPNPRAIADYLLRQPLMVKHADALIPITPQVAESMAAEISDLL